MKTYCISINEVNYRMNLQRSDVDGYYKYELIPFAPLLKKEVIYIKPNREGYLFNGKELDSRQVSYFFTL